jgi:23S rRNA (pseudouridine1915-N3)-methyltransferase
VSFELFCILKQSKDPLVEIAQEYLSRLHTPYQTQLRPLKLRKQFRDPSEQMQYEASIFSESISADQIILLSQKGKHFDTASFAQLLEQQLSRHKKIAFVIGGAFGFDPHFEKANPLKISLSNLTLAHKLALVVLSEQIYRAQCVLTHHPYAK